MSNLKDYEISNWPTISIIQKGEFSRYRNIVTFAINCMCAAYGLSVRFNKFPKIEVVLLGKIFYTGPIQHPIVTVNRCK